MMYVSDKTSCFSYAQTLESGLYLEDWILPTVSVIGTISIDPETETMAELGRALIERLEMAEYGTKLLLGILSRYISRYIIICSR